MVRIHLAIKVVSVYSRNFLLPLFWLYTFVLPSVPITFTIMTKYLVNSKGEEGILFSIFKFFFKVQFLCTLPSRHLRSSFTSPFFSSVQHHSVYIVREILLPMFARIKFSVLFEFLVIAGNHIVKYVISHHIISHMKSFLAFLYEYGRFYYCTLFYKKNISSNFYCERQCIEHCKRINRSVDTYLPTNTRLLLRLQKLWEDLESPSFFFIDTGFKIW